MDLFMVLQLLCGLALFLFGMNSMGDGLESLSGGKLEKTVQSVLLLMFRLRKRLKRCVVNSRQM